jgi:hypothetical protein
MMFNPPVGVGVGIAFDDVLLVLFIISSSEFMPPRPLPLPELSSMLSSSVNNSPTISIGMASTRSLTSISGKRIEGSPALLVDIDRHFFFFFFFFFFFLVY